MRIQTAQLKTFTLVIRVNKLSDVQREAIDQPVTLYELKHALKGMREEGSPGPNGLTVQFFKYFF